MRFKDIFIKYGVTQQDLADRMGMNRVSVSCLLSEKNDLRISTIHPNYDRALLQLTVQDIKKQIQEIRDIQSNLSCLLEDVDMASFEF